MTRTGDLIIAQNFIGVDISKDWLDLHDLSANRTWRVENERSAIDTLIRDHPDAFFVFEATSVCDRLLRERLSRAERDFARVNPRQAREFAWGEAMSAIGSSPWPNGVLAKTDAVDARVLAKMGSVLEPRPSVEASPERLRLAELNQRRRQLIDLRKQEKQHLEQAQSADMAASARDVIRLIERRIAKIEALIGAHIKAHDELAQAERRMQSVPGIGPVVSRTLIADLPELGTLDRRAIASLAGLAPHARDSGKRTGQRQIWGGRTHVRQALYIAALAASRFDPYFRAVRKRLEDAGKAKKVAIIAIARKLITILNAMIKAQRNYREKA